MYHARNNGARAPSIESIPDETKDKLTSSIAINDLTDVVIGLMLNALDARSTRIACDVNLAERSCVVEDNGCGIPAIEFGDEGGLARQNFTSKLGDVVATGCSGTFLASLAALAHVSITSCTSTESHFVSNLVLHNSIAITSSAAKRSTENTNLGSRGTRVSVRNLFQNVPVRSKQYEQQHNKTTSAKQWTLLKNQTVSMLLAWPHAVRILITEAAQQWKMRLGETSNEGEPSTNLGVRPTNDRNRELRLLTQAGYVLPDAWTSWIPIDGSNRHLSILGAISLEPSSTKHCQFISLGHIPIWKSAVDNELYDTVARLFSDSSFGVYEGPAVSEAPKSRGKEGEEPSQLKTFRKGLFRNPMFYFKIDWKEQHAAYDSQFQFELILSSLSKVINQWLRRHCFKPQSLKRPVDEVTKSDARSESYAKGSKLEGSTTQKVPSLAHNTLYDQTTPFRHDKHNLSSSDPLPSSGHPHQLESPALPSFKGWSKLKGGSLVKNVQQAKEDCFLHSDNSYFRTECTNDPLGESYSSVDFLPLASRNQQPRSIPIKRLKSKQMSQSKDGKPAKKPTWLSVVLNGWKNPVFQHSVEQSAITGPQVSNGLEICTSAATPQKDRSVLSAMDISLACDSRLYRSGIRQAQVIGQVDSKFILLKIADVSEGDEVFQNNLHQDTIALLDQHAADERCIVEKLFSELCAIGDHTPSEVIETYTSGACATIVKLQPAISFQISEIEASMLESYTQDFARWGVSYSIGHLSQQPSTSGATKDSELAVKGLPSSIAERCRAEPKVLLDILLTEAWRWEEYGRPRACSTIEGTRGDTHTWLRRIGDCPQGLVDMLNSRACRSAIMFNDKLSPDQCRGLVSRLRDCALPFQCAHGRPSIVPLCTLGISQHGTELTGGNGFQPLSFVAAFKQWANGTPPQTGTR